MKEKCNPNSFLNIHYRWTTPPIIFFLVLIILLKHISIIKLCTSESDERFFIRPVVYEVKFFLHLL